MPSTVDDEEEAAAKKMRCARSSLVVATHTRSIAANKVFKVGASNASCCCRSVTSSFQHVTTSIFFSIATKIREQHWPSSESLIKVCNEDRQFRCCCRCRGGEVASLRFVVK